MDQARVPKYRHQFWAGNNDLTGISFSIYEFRRASIFGYIDSNEIGLSYMPLLSVLIGVLLYNNGKSYKYFLFLGGISAVLTNGRYIMISFVLI